MTRKSRMEFAAVNEGKESGIGLSLAPGGMRIKMK
jgi:hypothetical protein